MANKSLETQLSEVLMAAGLQPDKVEKHYNGTVTLKFRKEDETDTVRLFDQTRRLAWRVWDVIPDSEILEYYEAAEGWNGRTYHVLVLKPSLTRVALPLTKGQLKLKKQGKAVEATPRPTCRRPERPKPAPEQKSAIAFNIGEQVWAAVKFAGKPVRIKGEVRQVMGNVAVVKSNRTQQEYSVPAHLIFGSRPGEEVLGLVS